MSAASAFAFSPPEKLVVVTDVNYPPYLFRTDDGQLEGILKDKWALWSSRTGVPAEIVGMEWSKAQESILEGATDVIEALAYTEARTRLYEYSPAYATIDARVYFHRTISGISNDVASLRGFRIGAKHSSACASWLADRGIDSIYGYPTSEALVQAAGAGEVRLFCMDTPAAQYFLFKLGLADEFRETPPLYSTHFHWAVRKGQTELRDFIQSGFERITPEEIGDIDARWLGNPLRFPIHTRYLYYLGFLAASIFAAAALLVFWNRSLRFRVATRTAELRTAMESLQKYADDVSDLYNNAPCGYHSLDKDGVVVRINDTELAWLGRARDEVIATRFTAFLTEEGRQRFQEDFPKLKELGTLRDLQYELVRKDGSTMPVMASATAVRDREGKFLMSRSTVYDMTERKRVEIREHEDAERLRTLSRRLIEAQEAERRAIARELHDEVGQSLTAVQATLQSLKQLTAETAFVDRLDESAAYVNRVIDEIRNASMRLRPSVLDDLGLVPALRWLVRSQSRAAAIDISLELDSLSTDVPPAVATGCYRIVQEAITNAIRHARAKRVVVRLAEAAERLEVDVEDDGAGFDVGEAQARASHGQASGLTGMRERAELLGGAWQVRAAPGKGTIIHASLPLLS